MALAVDSQMTAGAGASGTNVSSLSFSFTNTAGTLVVVGVAQSSRTLTSITCGGVTMTIDFQQTNGNCRSSLAHLLTPGTGAKTIVVTMGGGATVQAGAISFTGNDAVNPVVAAIGASGSGTLLSYDLDGILGGSTVVDVSWSGQAFGVTTGSTRTWIKNVSNAGNGESSYYPSPFVEGSTLSISKTIATSATWSAAIVEIRNPAYTAPPKRLYNLLGCGS